MRKPIIISALFVLSLAAYGQEAEPTDTGSVARDIRIEKEYVPDISDARRLNLEYGIQEPGTTRSDIIYSNYAAAVSPQSNFYPLDARQQNSLKRKSAPRGYAALGVGYPLNWMAEAFYPILTKGSSYLDLMLEHDGFSDGPKQIIDTRFDILFKQKIGRSANFFATAGYQNNYFSYFGADSVKHLNDHKYIHNGLLGEQLIPGDSLCPARGSLHRANASAGIHSLRPLNNFDYHARFDYNMLYVQKIGVHEHIVNLDGGMAYNLAGHKLLVNADLNMTFYGEPRQRLQYEALDNNVVLGLKPAYNLSFKDLGLNLRLGAKIYFSFLRGRAINAMPDVMVSYSYGHLLNAYIGAAGDYHINTLSSALDECRYFNTYGQLGRNTYSPAKFSAGFAITPTTGLSVSAFVSYRFVYDDHFFRNKEYIHLYPDPQTGDTTRRHVFSNVFTADYAHYQNLTAGGRIAYSFKDQYIAHAECRYNYYHKFRTDTATQTIYAWNKPTGEVEVGVEAKPTEDIAAYANFYYGTGYRTVLPGMDGTQHTVKMRDHLDLNIGISYTIKSRFTVFAKGNNLLGFGKLRYEDFYGYENFGPSCLFGVKIGF